MLSRSSTYAALGEGPNAFHFDYVVSCSLGSLLVVFSFDVETKQVTSCFIACTVVVEVQNSIYYNVSLKASAFVPLCHSFSKYLYLCVMSHDPSPCKREDPSEVRSEGSQMEPIAAGSHKNPNPTSWVGSTITL